MGDAEREVERRVSEVARPICERLLAAYTAVGGLMSYGPNLPAAFRTVGGRADEVIE